MNVKEKIEELREASEDGTITAAQVTEAGLHRRPMMINGAFNPLPGEAICNGPNRNCALSSVRASFMWMEPATATSTSS